MSKKLTVKVPAVKHKDGTISKAPNASYSHEEIIEKVGKKGQHGFMLSNGEFANRTEAAKVAEAAGEVPKSAGKKLHSHELRQGLGIKKAKLK
jgi:hypothetical protein